MTPSVRVPKPPSHLTAARRDWWASVHDKFELEPHHERLLTLAAEAWDRAQGAREAIAKHGTTYTNRSGEPRARPECAIERDARIGFARLVRELRLDVAPPDEPRIPPLNGGRAHA